MSPVGGVGVNIAVQDSVAAANQLAGPLKSNTVTDDDLAAIERRRTFPVRFTQRIQLIMQNQIIKRALSGAERPKPPLLFRLFNIFPVLRRIPARVLGLGIRPEHVHTPDVLASSNPQAAPAA
jgi:2-polyprenyl-6-methoxyphenol hydroxylase-like FAD-dependent oxidoreductase